MAVTPTIETPFEPRLPQLPVLPEIVDSDNLKQVLEEFLEYQNQLARSLRDFGRAVNSDISLGHTVYPKTTAAVAANVLEDGLCMEWTDPVALAWAKINGTLRILTNCPQGYIIYATTLQNTAVAGWGTCVWNFPQGGFKAATYPTILCSLEGPAAHMNLDGYEHGVYNTNPTAAAVTFYINEWFEIDAGLGLGPRRTPCVTNTVYVNAMAMGVPK